MVTVKEHRRPGRRLARQAALAQRRADKKARLSEPVVPPPPPRPPRPRPPRVERRAPVMLPGRLDRFLAGDDALFAATAVVMLGKHLIRARLDSRQDEASDVLELQADSPEAAAAIIERLDPFQREHGPDHAQVAS